MDLPDKTDIAIIGGGAVGLSVACHLARRGAKDVVLLERHRLTSGTSWHAAGIIGPLRASMALTRLSVYAIELFGTLERETGLSTGYRRTGGLWLAQTQDRMTELRRIADIGLLAGLDAAILTPEQARRRHPLLATDGLAGALWVEEDGQANPVDICMAYARAARMGGVRIVENAPVRTVHGRNGAVAGVELADGHRISCRIAVNCAGAWARQLAAASAIAVPLQAVEHMYVVSEPVPGLPQPCPIVRDLDGRIYIKEDAGRLVLGGFEPDAKPFDVAGPGGDTPFVELPEDWAQFEPFMAAGLRRIPALAETGIQHFMNGPESFTPDTAQLIGEAPEMTGYFVAAGFNSIGIVSSAGAGRVLADWIVDGEMPMDLLGVDVARFEPDMAAPAFLTARVQEAVASQFEMHWPFRQPKTGRDLRHLPAHDLWRREGAVFGAPAGWERPLWFGAPADLRYGYAAQNWWPAAERESLAARDGAVLIDLSPFSKFDVTGPNALAALQRLCTRDMDIATGRSVYTPLLGERGGVIADATAMRLAGDRFRIVGAAPYRRRDLARLTRLAPEATIVDVTRDHAVLGLMGPNAGAILAAIGGPAEVFPFGSVTAWCIDGNPVLAHRVSYIGEYGFELMMPWDAAAGFASKLLQAGARPMGLLAVDCCRMEKGFRHFGHDMGPEDSPLETGLGFAVSWDKPSGFIGREALLRQREAGVRRRLVQFALADGHPLLLHDEPLFRHGKLAGHTTSGAHGFRTGLSLCFGTVRTEPGETPADLAASQWEISIAGERHGLRLLERPPYDPAGARMRGGA